MRVHTPSSRSAAGHLPSTSLASSSEEACLTSASVATKHEARLSRRDEHRNSPEPIQRRFRKNTMSVTGSPLAANDGAGFESWSPDIRGFHVFQLTVNAFSPVLNTLNGILV